MIDLREYLKGIAGVATALEAMCNGLQYQDSRKDFTIDMSSFGGSAWQECFGCAATCALQEIADVNFFAGNINSMASRCNAGNFSSAKDFHIFENVIDSVRFGNLRPLYNFCGVGYDQLRKQNWCLGSTSWKKELPKVRRYIRKIMKDNNLEWGYSND